jgi:hypothetical protein
MKTTPSKFTSALFPAEPRVFPFRRGVRIALRTAHILASGILLGGYVFNEPTTVLEPWLWSSVITGLLLFATDLFATLVILFELHAIAVVVKIILLAFIPVVWDCRVTLLVIILVIGAITSHMPGRFRHRLVFFRSHFATHQRRV